MWGVEFKLVCGKQRLPGDASGRWIMLSLPSGTRPSGFQPYRSTTTIHTPSPAHSGTPRHQQKNSLCSGKRPDIVSSHPARAQEAAHHLFFLPCPPAIRALRFGLRAVSDGQNSSPQSSVHFPYTHGHHAPHCSTRTAARAPHDNQTLSSPTWSSPIYAISSPNFGGCDT